MAGVIGSRVAVGCWALIAFLAFGGLAPAFADTAAPKTRFDHVFLIVLENHDFEESIDPRLAPFMASLAQANGLATRYYGVSHPSLPNYLAMIGGDDFGVKDDSASCYASDLRPDQACHKVEGESLVDQLEAAGMSFTLYAQSARGLGDLSQGHPPYPGDLFAQKHIPVAYFETFAHDPARLARLKPMSDLAGDLAAGAANFSFIVPDQCHDGHGLRTSCNDPKKLSADYDATVAELVGAIKSSPAWTRKSAIVVTFDEGEYRNGPPADPVDDNRIATLVITPCGAPRVSEKRYDHFALLATIEDGFGLARLRKAKEAPPMTDLFGEACP